MYSVNLEEQKTMKRFYNNRGYTNYKNEELHQLHEKHGTESNIYSREPKAQLVNSFPVKSKLTTNKASNHKPRAVTNLSITKDASQRRRSRKDRIIPNYSIKYRVHDPFHPNLRKPPIPLIKNELPSIKRKREHVKMSSPSKQVESVPDPAPITPSPKAPVPVDQVKDTITEEANDVNSLYNYNSEIRELKETVTDMHKTLKKIADVNLPLQQECKNQRSEINGYKKRIKHLTLQVRHLEDEISKCKSRIEGKDMFINSQTQDIESQKQIIEDLEKELDEKQKQITQLETENSDLKDTIQTIEEEASKAFKLIYVI